MVDNLFIVESPLQALVAVELSLQFVGQKNGVIFRLSGLVSSNKCSTARF